MTTFIGDTNVQLRDELEWTVSQCNAMNIEVIQRPTKANSPFLKFIQSNNNSFVAQPIAFWQTDIQSVHTCFQKVIITSDIQADFNMNLTFKMMYESPLKNFP